MSLFEAHAGDRQMPCHAQLLPSGIIVVGQASEVNKSARTIPEHGYTSRQSLQEVHLVERPV